jgi:CRISPR system Cascade subunit CasC
MTTTNNPFKNIFIEFHILQSFPVTCLNRDDVGAPKTAVVGGVARARVSSQAWKRPVRLAMRDFGAKLGIRTKLISELIQEECIALGATKEQAKSCGDWFEGAFIKSKNTKPSKKIDDDSDAKNDSNESGTDDKSDIFLSPSEIKALAQKFADNKFGAATKLENSDQKKRAKEIAKILKDTNTHIDGIDIALFGRMVAQAAELDIEASASFAHAISTHKVSNEIEFFTAIDDRATDTESGSAHMGSLEFNSATYYRYISLNLGQLYDNLKGQYIPEAVESFVKALYVAVPTARQTTMSGGSSWDYANILVRKGQRLQLSFDKPTKTTIEGGYLQPSIEALEGELSKKRDMAGSLFGELRDIKLSAENNIDKLIGNLKEFTRSELKKYE